jgi:hypothetical protein
MTFAREGSQRRIAIDIMNANTDKPMAEVCKLIGEHPDWGNGDPERYYKTYVKRGWATGTVVKAERAPKPVKEAKAPKAPKAKAEKVSAPEKTPEEVEAIKAANLKRLKEVHGRYKQKVKKQEADEVIEVDPFGAPAALTAEEVHALV